MAGGSLIQLNAPLDNFDMKLIDKPHTSFFHSVYMRYHHFSIGTTVAKFQNSVDFGKQGRYSLKTTGDLISKITLNITLETLNKNKKNKNKNKNSNNHNSSLCSCEECLNNKYSKDDYYGWVNALGHALIKSTWIEIDGKIIGELTGEWLEIWSELTLTNEKRSSYYEMIGKVDPMSFTTNTFDKGMDLFIPLNFWFCKNTESALPLFCINSDVYLVVDFRKFNECWVKSSKNIGVPTKPKFSASLIMDYIFLGPTERESFKKSSHKYLFEEIQHVSSSNISNNKTIIDLQFKNPVKELIWVVQRSNATVSPGGTYKNTNYPIGNDWFNYSLDLSSNGKYNIDPFMYASYKIDREYIFKDMKSKYFRLVEPYYYHTRNPRTYIYTYSFSLEPEDHQPSGYHNFNTINNQQLIINFNDKLINKLSINFNVRVYAVSYNRLIVKDGLYNLQF